MQLLLLLFQIISACLFLWCISNQILFFTVFLSIPLYLNIISYFSLFHFFFLPYLSFLLFHVLLISSLSHHFLTFCLYLSPCLSLSPSHYNFSPYLPYPNLHLHSSFLSFPLLSFTLFHEPYTGQAFLRIWASPKTEFPPWGHFVQYFFQSVVGWISFIGK